MKLKFCFQKKYFIFLHKSVLCNYVKVSFQCVTYIHRLAIGISCFVSREMFGYFRVMLIFNHVYVYSARCNIEQDMRHPIFHCKSQIIMLVFKNAGENRFEKLHHIEHTTTY